MSYIDYVVCYSGGHSSALVAIEAVRRYGKECVTLLNHNISPNVEHKDIKRFKQEVADYLDLPIMYANMKGYEELDPIGISLKKGAFNVKGNQALCTYYLKTQPFNDWLQYYCPSTAGEIREDVIILYGFDENETARINRRVGVMNRMGYKTDYPLARWKRTIHNTEEIGIERPITYKIYKHANCVGCLKAGRQHWYVVYCLRPDIFARALKAEEELGYSIIKDIYLEELIPIYEDIISKGICPNDKEHPQTFWSRVRKAIPDDTEGRPCDCYF